MGALVAAGVGWMAYLPPKWMALGAFLSAPVYLTYHTYKVYLGRVEDERRHTQEMADLHLATIEALALYTGQLPPVVGGSSSLRERFLGGTHILSDPRDPRELVPAIMRGDVIMWGSAPGTPAAETYFPPDVCGFG